jgi:Cys-rich repeat protein
MKKLWKLLIAILLAGCATFGQMEDGLRSLMGKSDREAFSVLGYPSAKQEFGNDTVYSWYVSQSGSLFVPQTSTTTGYVGRTPVYGTTTYTQAIPVNYNCQIKLVADKGGILRSWEYNGNIGGCAQYINRLNTYAGSANTIMPTTPVPMECQVDSDCGQGQSCRSRKGGGTECRSKANASSIDETSSNLN